MWFRFFIAEKQLHWFWLNVFSLYYRPTYAWDVIFVYYSRENKKIKNMSTIPFMHVKFIAYLELS